MPAKPHRARRASKPKAGGRRGLERGETLLRADVARIALRVDNGLLLSAVKKDPGSRTENEEFRTIIAILTSRRFLDLQPPPNAAPGWEADAVAIQAARVANLNKEAQAALRFVIVTRGGFTDYASGASRQGDELVPWGIVVARAGLGNEERVRAAVAALDPTGSAVSTGLLSRAFESGRSHVEALQLQSGLSIEPAGLARKSGIFRVVDAPNGEQHLVFLAETILARAKDQLTESASVAQPSHK